MPSVIVTENANSDLLRLRDFIVGKNPKAADRAVTTLLAALRRLEVFPEMGRPHPGIPNLHVLSVPFGRAGYVVAYRFAQFSDEVQILAIRHQKESEDSE
ncbi:MAG: type II toxin-antitoxin system RelE/ParE family toxin [Halothiobacillaceae bacterium]